jgi:hypothetical protein
MLYEVSIKAIKALLRNINVSIKALLQHYVPLWALLRQFANMTGDKFVTALLRNIKFSIKPLLRH